MGKKSSTKSPSEVDESGDTQSEHGSDLSKTSLVEAKLSVVLKRGDLDEAGKLALK